MRMSWLDFFKKKPEEVPPLDLSWLQVDMHSHLIPGIDDGSKTLVESLELINRLAKLGLRKIITTPHIMSEYYRNTPEIIDLGLENLKKAVKSQGINIELEAAAEYYMDEIFLEKIKAGEGFLTFGDRFILVETGFINKPQMFLDITFHLEMAGYKPVLAHPERYQYLLSDKVFLKELIERNMLFQVNLLSLTGFYSKPVKDFSEMLIERKSVAFLGTDCHNNRYLDALETLPTHYKSYEKIKTLELLNHQL
jgi:tyrosine-protein phosphatase YwqE